jgi:hypothetical protein
LTNAEWLYLKQHGFDAVAPYFTGPEIETLTNFMQEAVDRQQREATRR